MPAISGVLAIRGLDVLFKYAFVPESLCAPDLTGIYFLLAPCLRRASRVRAVAGIPRTDS